MSLRCDNSFENVNLVVKILVLVFFVSDLNAMRRQSYALLQILYLMEFGYVTSDETLKGSLVGIELENGRSVCIRASEWWIHLREIILADLQVRLLCLR